MLADPIHLQLQRGVVAALPMQDHLDEATFDAHDDLAARPHARSSCVSLTVAAGCDQASSRSAPSCISCFRSFSPKAPVFRASSAAISPSIRCTACKRLVPAALQLASHQTIGGIDGIILPTRMGGLVARPLQRQLELPLCGRRLARLGLERLDRSIDAERLQNPQNLRADGMIGAQAAERDAPLGAVIDERTLAVIAPRLTAIAHVHLATAVAATQKAGEKQLPVPCRSSGDGASLAGRVVGDHPLVPLELGPGDVALVLVLEQHLPLGQGAAHPAPHPLAALLDADLACRSPEGIGARIDGVGQDVVHGVVEGQPPDDAAPLDIMRACTGSAMPSSRSHTCTCRTL